MYYNNLTDSMKSRRICATRFAHVSGTFKVPHYKLLPITEPIVYKDKNGKEHLVMISKDNDKASIQKELLHNIGNNINLSDNIYSFISNELKTFIDYDNHFSHISIMSVILNIIPNINEMELLSYFYFYIERTKSAFGTSESVM